jgi:RHS repeat-associated protein
VDASTGTLTAFAYSPYGSATSTPNLFGFTGQRFDSESLLYYYRARHYSAAWGRFLQADPLGYAAGSLLYAYVGNDPLNFLDPFGTNSEAATSILNRVFSLLGPFDPNTLPQRLTLAGAIIGALEGGIAGGAAGGISGAAGGTMVVPGIGTISGAVAGTVVGAAEGASIGAALGGYVGYQAGSAARDFIIYMQGNGASGGGGDNRGSSTVNAGNLKEASMNDLRNAAQQDGYKSVEAWKQQELGLNSRDQIYKDRTGNLYSLPRKGAGTPQPLNVKVP